MTSHLPSGFAAMNRLGTGIPSRTDSMNLDCRSSRHLNWRWYSGAILMIPSSNILTNSFTDRSYESKSTFRFWSLSCAIDPIAQLNDQKRKVDFDSYDLSVKELVSMFDEGIINIAPEYQRQFRWREDRQSKFIESVLLGIPVPSLFMAANPDGKWEVIDGVQRLSTLIHFAGSPAAQKKLQLKDCLRLTELEQLDTFDKKTF